MTGNARMCINQPKKDHMVKEIRGDHIYPSIDNCSSDQQGLPNCEGRILLGGFPCSQPAKHGQLSSVVPDNDSPMIKLVNRNSKQ